MVNFTGQTGDLTEVIGQMENSMEGAYIEEVMVKRERENG